MRKNTLGNEGKGILAKKRIKKIIVIASIFIIISIIVGYGIYFIPNIIDYNANQEIVLGDTLELTNEGTLYFDPVPSWHNILKSNLIIEKNKYSPDEEITVKFCYGLNGSFGPGDLKITIECIDFDIDTDKQILTEDFTYDNYKNTESGFACEKQINLTPNNTGAVFGDFKISFVFIPESYETFEFQESWESLHNGELGVRTLNLVYVINEFQIVFDSTIGAYDLFQQNLCSLYSVRKISGKEFAKRYFDVQYQSRISSAVSVENPDGRIRFFYLSKNIRYASGDISNTELYDKEKECRTADSENSKILRKQFARMSLEWMLENDIISEQQYQAECIWLNECEDVDSSSAMFGSSLAGYMRVLNRYMYTD